MIISIGGSEREIRFNWNTISFNSRLQKISFIEQTEMIFYDPIGVVRDIVYSSLKVYPDGDFPDGFDDLDSKKQILVIGEWLQDLSPEDLRNIQIEILTAFGLNEPANDLAKKTVKKKK